MAGASIYIRSKNAAAGTDISWLLVVVKKWLAGGRYIKDFYEVNPPASFLIYIPAYFLSKIINLDSLLCVNILYCIFGIFCLHLAVKISIKYDVFRNSIEEKSMFFMLFLGFIIFPDDQTIAQRDVILTLASLPYLLKRLNCSSEEKRIDSYFIISLLALWIKPQCAIAYVIVWIFAYFLYEIKIKWYEPVLIIVSLSLYAFIIHGFFFEWWHIAAVAIKTYDAYGASFYLLMPKFLIGMILTSAFYLLGGNKKNIHYLIVGGAFFLLALAQKKYFLYYYYSGEVLIFINILFLLKNRLLFFCEKFGRYSTSINMVLVGTISLFYLSYCTMQENKDYTYKNKELDTIVKDHIHNNEKVFIFSLYIDASYPFLKNYNGTAYPALWPLKIFLEKNYFEHKNILYEIKEWLSEYFLKDKPKLVIIPYAYISKNYALSLLDNKQKKFECDKYVHSECEPFKRLEKVMEVIGINKLLEKNYHLIKFIRLDDSPTKVAVYLINDV